MPNNQESFEQTVTACLENEWEGVGGEQRWRGGIGADSGHSKAKWGCAVFYSVCGLSKLSACTQRQALQGSFTIAATLSKNMPVFCESAIWCRRRALQTWHQESTATRGSVIKTYQHQC